MFISGKIASITMSAVLGMGGIGVAGATLSDSDQEGSNNPMPVVSTDNSQPSDITMQENTNFGSIATSAISSEQMKKLHDQWLDVSDYGLKTKTGDLYDKMVQKGQPLMQNITREQMVELNREWMEQTETLHHNWEMLVKNSSAEGSEELYERMMEVDQQMMKGVTPEQFEQLNTAWMNQSNHQHQVSASSSNAQENMGGKATTNPSSSITEQEMSENNQGMNWNSSHNNTNSNHTRTETDHRGNMNQGRQNMGHH